MADGKQTGYIRESGMTQAHFQTVQEAAKQQQVIAVVRNTNTASTPLIQRGCPGKPLEVKVNTDPTTGIVTAKTPAEIQEAHKAGYYVIDPDGVARRPAQPGKLMKQELRLDRPFWRTAPGQVIDKSGMPLVGDYDLHGVIDPKNPGQNIVLVANKGENVKNIESPIVRKFRSAVNPRFDRPRMLHGAQDQYASFRGGATVFMPDGTVKFLPTEHDVKMFYEELGRQTIKGTYNPKPPSSKLIRTVSVSRPATGGAKGLLQNQNAMAFLGMALGAGLQWLGDIGIRRNIENQLKTTFAKRIGEEFAQGNGVLVIIRMQEWARPDFNGMRARGLLGVYVEGGKTQEEALEKWRQPKLLQGPPEGWRDYEEYMWLEQEG